MSEFKVVIADPKTGKCYQREIKDVEAKVFLGLKIKNNVKGDSFGLSGYEFEITGGSDKSGFPMRKDLEGTARKRILAIAGVGLKRKRKGQRQRKNIRGNTISSQISQINLKILKYGKEKLGGEEVAEETKVESKVEEKKESPKEEVKEPPKEDKAPVKKEKSEPKTEEKFPEIKEEVKAEPAPTKEKPEEIKPK